MVVVMVLLLLLKAGVQPLSLQEAWRTRSQLRGELKSTNSSLLLDVASNRNFRRKMFPATMAELDTASNRLFDFGLEEKSRKEEEEKADSEVFHLCSTYTR